MKKFKKIVFSSFFSILFFLLLFFLSLTHPNAYAQKQNPTTINVVIPTLRGGFGDLAANLLMIERLIEIAPKNFEFNLVISNEGTIKNGISVPTSEEIANKLKVLWPDYNPELSVQTLERRSLKVYSETEAPMADIAISFSGATFPKRTSYKRFGNLELLYREPGDLNYSYQGKLWRVWGTAFEFFKNRLRSDSLPMNLFIHSGSDLGGFYLLPKNSNDLESKRSSDLEKINSFLVQNQKPLVEGDDALAFAYTRTEATIGSYLFALIKLANSKPYRDKRIVTFLQKIPESIDLPPNLILIESRSIPFDVTQAILRQADIPPLVTGDGSLSLALEKGIPFLYEVNAWKVFSIESLLKEIVSRSDDFQENPQLKDILFRSLTLDINGGNSDPDLILQTFTDPNYKAAFSKAMESVQQDRSLPQNVLSLIRILPSVDLNYSSDLGITLVIQFAQKFQGDPRKVFQALRNTALDPENESRLRIQSLMALLEMKNWDTPKNLEVFYHLFSDPDSGFHYLFKFWAGENLRHPILEKLFRKALFHKDQKIQKGVRDLLHLYLDQDPFQWGNQANRTKAHSLLRELLIAEGNSPCMSIFLALP